VVELFGASALLPYALVNCRHVTPHYEERFDPENEDPEDYTKKWREYGNLTEFDIFVLVPT